MRKLTFFQSNCFYTLIADLDNTCNFKNVATIRVAGSRLDLEIMYFFEPTVTWLFLDFWNALFYPFSTVTNFHQPIPSTKTTLVPSEIIISPFVSLKYDIFWTMVTLERRAPDHCWNHTQTCTLYHYLHSWLPYLRRIHGMQYISDLFVGYYIFMSQKKFVDWLCVKLHIFKHLATTSWLREYNSFDNSFHFMVSIHRFVRSEQLSIDRSIICSILM